jgi:cytochrome P450
LANSLPKASLWDTLAVATEVFISTVAKGVILRRPRVVALAERLQLDRKAIRCLQRLRRRYGDGPLLLRIPGRSQAIVLAPEHVRRVLDETPAPFATASSEKQAALEHFEPHGVLISTGAIRAERRRVNERVLQSDCPRHAFAGRFASIVRDETPRLVDRSHRALTWPTFAASWQRIVRQVMLGDAARDDAEITNMLAHLRRDANWAFAHTRRRKLRERFLKRLTRYVERAEPGTLASAVAAYGAEDDVDAIGQMPQWLFAADAAGIATFRALALLATHPERAVRAHDEIRHAGDNSTPKLPFLRACVMESVRLWPTTPMILRETDTPTSWSNGDMPAKTGVLIFVPFFHRDDGRLSFADRFEPERWMGGADPERWPLVPFSAGPARCPGQQMVLLLTSLVLSSLLRDCELRPQPERAASLYRAAPPSSRGTSARTAMSICSTRTRKPFSPGAVAITCSLFSCRSVST